MLSTNQGHAQESPRIGRGPGNALEGVTNFPEELNTTGVSPVFLANSPGMRVSGGSKSFEDHTRLPLGPRPRKGEISLRAHIKNAQATVTELRRRKQRAEGIQDHQRALAWLAQNRGNYAGQWIALRGSELLAAGTSAREVYARVRSVMPSPLILKIEMEDLPFAGW